VILSTEKPILVFVHLGPRKVNFLEANISRIRKLFPDVKIVVIYDEQSSHLTNVIHGVDFFEYKRELNLERHLQFNPVIQRFRQGFWQFTLERFFALTQFHKSIPASSIVHLESDVLILPSFPIDKFSTLKSIYWSRFNESKDVAAILFLPNLEESMWLESELVNQLKLDSRHTDMTVLSKIAHLYPERIQILPSIDKSRNSKLLNKANNEVKNDFGLISQQLDYFEGIFDPAAIGMWLCGMDPENYHGKLVLHSRSFIETGDSFIDPGGAGYQIDSFGGLYIRSERGLIPIHNLHVHSKDIKIFSKNWITEIRKYISVTSRPETIRKRFFRNYRRVYFSHLKQGDVFRYLATHPSIYPRAKSLMSFLRKLSY
jgi:hypothetical protein